jgi:hypothetical protein
LASHSPRADCLDRALMTGSAVNWPQSPNYAIENRWQAVGRAAEGKARKVSRGRVRIARRLARPATEAAYRDEAVSGGTLIIPISGRPQDRHWNIRFSKPSVAGSTIVSRMVEPHSLHMM